VLDQPRSTQRYVPTVKEEESQLISRILELVREFPRFGYRQITRLLRSEGWQINFKRVYRLWQQEGLKVPRKKQKRKRLGDSSGGILRRKSERMNQVWSMDFIFDRTTNSRAIKILSIIDEYTRECIALSVSRKFTSDDVIAALVDLIAIRGVPAFVRCDNGPEFISKSLRKFLERIDVGTSYIEPGSPWENGFVESFHSRFRNECLACEEFTTISEAMTVIDEWRNIYNQRRPHSSLGGQTPAEFASQCAASVPGENPPPAPSLPPLQRHTADLIT
tara:strand:- start:10480 stop:11310 length:831 start_codon:yes stop_codon:yes gene_type:complete